MKIYLFLCSIIAIAISLESKAQILNQSANWPNLSWQVEGIYNSIGLINRPDSAANFTYDDDASGFLSVDMVSAESPIIDLTSAFSGGEKWINVDGNYSYYAFNSDILILEYWDADASIWKEWHTFTGNTTTPPDFQDCVNMSPYTSGILNITFFSSTQLAGFKYRFRYTDIGGWQWGFCLDSPKIVSSTPPLCPSPSDISVSSYSSTSINLSWTENGSATSWDIEWGFMGFLPSGTPSIFETTSNPHNLIGLSANTTYDFYVRSSCGGSSSNWVGPYTITTRCAPSSFPYAESFDGIVPDLPSCWLTNNPSQVSISSGCAGSTNESLQVYGLEGVYALSPLIDVSGQSSVEVSYLYRAGGDTDCNNNPEPGDNINVDYWNGSMWVNIANHDGADSPITFTEVSYIITSGLTSSFQLRFHMQAGLGPGFDNYNFDNLEVKAPASDDIGIIDIDAASPGCNLGMEEITVNIKNYGAAAQYNFDVSYILNGTAITPETVTDTILPGDTLKYSFSTLADMTAFNNYVVNAWTNLLSDIDNSNDTLKGFMTENVEPSLMHNGVDTINSFMGLQSVICTEGLVQNLLDSNYQLIGVVIDSLTHNWETDIHMYLISPSGDSLELSTGNGFEGPGGYSNVTFTDTATTNITSVSAITGGFYTAEEEAGLAKFNGTNPNGTWILLVSDNLPIIDDGVLYSWHLEFLDLGTGINTVSKSEDIQINIFPNPNSGLFTLNIKSTDIKELKIEITNQLGQVVFTKNNFKDVQNVNKQIDLNKNAKGVYFVTVTSGIGIVTRKIVIQ